MATHDKDSCIFGYTGFVGRNLLQFYTFDQFYNSANFKDARNREFGDVFFCGMPAVKWLANKDPDNDLATLMNIMEVLSTIKAQRFVLISTIDVYPVSYGDELDEDSEMDISTHHAYGKHRRMFETFVHTTFPCSHIVRLPALFGKGLKKNALYDFIHNNNVSAVPLSSHFQWYDLQWLGQDIDRIVRENIPVCNLFTEPVSTRHVLALFGDTYPPESDTAFWKNTAQINYNIRTKYAPTGYVRCAQTVLESMQAFVAFHKKQTSHLSVATICCPKHIPMIQFAELLVLHNIRNVQIAPTMFVSSWDELDRMDLSIFTSRNIAIRSFQSITFGLNHLNIFLPSPEPREQLMKHLKCVVRVAVKHDVRRIVFGCPKNRYRLSTSADAIDIPVFCDFFRQLGEYIQSVAGDDNDLTLCIEPNAVAYGCNFLTSIDDAGNMVNRIHHPRIKLMVDVGNALMEKDTLQNMVRHAHNIYNVDIARENMLPFVEIDPYHVEFKRILDSIFYFKSNTGTLEMVLGPTDPVALMSKSFHQFINIFGNI